MHLTRFYYSYYYYYYSYYTTFNFLTLVSHISVVIMAALCNRADHHIFARGFYLSFFFFFSSPNLSGRRLDVHHTSTHGVAAVRI